MPRSCCWRANKERLKFDIPVKYLVVVVRLQRHPLVGRITDFRGKFQIRNICNGAIRGSCMQCNLQQKTSSDMLVLPGSLVYGMLIRKWAPRHYGLGE